MKLSLESSSYSFEAESGEAPVTIGRGDDCKFIVDEPDVSRKHAEFSYDDGWVITDLSSRHGTQVNGKPITAATKLTDGDVIRISKQNLLVSIKKGDSLANMEALGAQLAGGQLKDIIKTATNKHAPKGSVRSPLAQKRKQPSATEIEAKEKAAESEVAAEDEPASEEGDASAKAALKRPMTRKVQRRGSALKSFLSFLLCFGILGGGGYFAYQYNEKLKQQAGPVQPASNAAAVTPAEKPAEAAPQAKPSQVEEAPVPAAPSDTEKSATPPVGVPAEAPKTETVPNSDQK